MLFRSGIEDAQLEIGFEEAVTRLQERARGADKVWLCGLFVETRATGDRKRPRVLGHLEHAQVAKDPGAILGALDDQMLRVVRGWSVHAPPEYAGLEETARLSRHTTLMMGVYAALLRRSAERLTGLGVPVEDVRSYLLTLLGDGAGTEGAP